MPYKQSDMTHIEPLLERAFPLAMDISAKLQPARQDEALHIVPFTRAVTYADGTYELFEAQPLNVPASVDFRKIEEETYEALDALAAEHSLLLRPAFYLPKPHHARYIPAIEAYDGEHGVLATMGRSYVMLSFHPLPYVDVSRKWDGVSFSTDLRVGGALLYSQVRVELPVLGTGALDRFMASLR